MEQLKKTFKGLGELVGRMSPSQVMMLLGVVAGTLVGTIYLVGWLSSVSYATLYSNLDESEAGEITTFLTEQKISYQLANGGRTIEVPSDDVHKTRIALATEGLPNSGTVGYSIFDQNNLGMTDFLQNLNFRRALEGELTRTIMQLNEVDAARVHIVMPKDKLFKEDQKEATASVVLKLRGRESLTKPKLAGVSHLVASSVEGLSPGNVTIVDYNGNLLSGGRDEDLVAGLSASQMEVSRQVEKHLESKAQSMLDEVLGPGTSVVRVTALLDFQQIERTSEMYDPNAPSVRSEERVKTSRSASDKAEESSESQQEDSEETVRTNYELNKTVEHAVNAVGNIDRISVAVMLDGTYEEVVAEDGTTQSVYQPRSPEELDRLESIVKNAVGFDGERSDQIEMVNIPFDRRDLEEDRQLLDSMYQREFLWEVGKKVGTVLLILLALLYFRKKAKKLFSALGKLLPPPPKPRPAAEKAAVAAYRQEEQEEPEEPLEAEHRRPKLVDRMQETAKEQPEEIARVIKTIMME